MAKPSSYMDPGILKATTKHDQVKKVKNSLSSPPQQVDPSQTKIINPIKNPKQESKTDYSGNPKELGGFTNQCLVSPVYTSHLTQLKKLDLSSHGLTTFPEDLLLCDKLEELNLSNNPLGPSFKFPKWLYFRDSLKQLDLSGCGLTTFPGDFWWCDKLEELNISNNSLGPSFKFSELLHFPDSLKKLDLSGCGLRTFPEDYWWCDELEELNLSKNPLGPSCIFPKKRCLFFSLKKLDLSGCGLKEWPCTLENYSSLQELNLSNNFIGHEDLLEKLNSGKMFISHSSLYTSGKGLFGPLARIIFEDTVYTQSNGG